ncbi:MAG TPA: RNA polymerase subunit sigma-70, partial [Polyangia bacterium]
VQGAALPDRDLQHQRRVVDAFFAASRGGDFDALVAVLDPDVVLRAALPGGESRTVRGATKVAKQSLLFSRRPMPTRVDRAVLVNGAPGIVVFAEGKPFSLLGFTVAHDKIVAIDIIADPERLARLDLAELAP